MSVRLAAPPCASCHGTTFLLVLPEEKRCMVCLKIPELPLIRDFWQADYFDPETKKIFIMVESDDE